MHVAWMSFSFFFFSGRKKKPRSVTRGDQLAPPDRTQSRLAEWERSLWATSQVTKAESFSCSLFSCSASALLTASHAHNLLGFDYRLDGCGARAFLRVRTYVLCCHCDCDFDLSARDAGWREGVMSLYNSWALSEESSIYMRSVISR